MVANLYYAQPVLHQVARAFSSGPGATSSVITATQIGYAAGLLLIVPLGDLHPRRTLVTRLFAVSTIALVACALAPNLWLFALASVAVGAASVAGQVMIPFAADLAPEERRGRVVARIMTGLLTGILLARTVSGLVAQIAGWRAIYWFSAALMVCFALILWRALPAEGPRPHRSYGELVGGSLRLLVTEPVLRRRAFHGACAFAAFSVLWTTLAFLLSARPYNYSNLVIGLFGLVGAGGIAAANLAGKLADSDRHTASTIGAGVLLAGSFGLLWLGRTSWPPSSSASSCSTSAPRACRSRTRPSSTRCGPTRAAASTAPTWSATSSVAPWGRSPPARSTARTAGPGVCVLGTGFGLATLAMSAFDRLRPPASRPQPSTISSPLPS